MDAERYCSIGIRYLLRPKKIEVKLPAHFAHRVDTWHPEMETNERDAEDY